MLFFVDDIIGGNPIDLGEWLELEDSMTSATPVMAIIGVVVIGLFLNYVSSTWFAR